MHALNSNCGHLTLGYDYLLVSVLKLLESLESFVIERRQSDSWGCRCGRRKTDRDTIVII